MAVRVWGTGGRIPVEPYYRGEEGVLYPRELRDGNQTLENIERNIIVTILFFAYYIGKNNKNAKNTL